MSDAEGSAESAEDAANASVDVPADVEAALSEFLDALGESETYRQFVEADEALGNDPDATALLREYRQKRQQVQDGEFGGSAMEELQRLRTEVSDDGTIQRRKAARAELVELLRRSDDAISDEIGDAFAGSSGGGCC